MLAELSGDEQLRRDLSGGQDFFVGAAAKIFNVGYEEAAAQPKLREKAKMVCRQICTRHEVFR